MHAGNEAQKQGLQTPGQMSVEVQNRIPLAPQKGLMSSWTLIKYSIKKVLKVTERSKRASIKYLIKSTILSIVRQRQKLMV